MNKVSVFLGLALLTLSGTAWAQNEAAAPAPGPATVPAGEPAAAPAPAPAATPAPAVAATPMGGKLTLGADAAFQLPVGNLSDGTGVGFGALVRGEYNLMPKLNGTLRIGYIYSLKKDVGLGKASMDNIPIWVGAKYFLTDMFYGGAEVGLNLLQEKVETSAFGSTVSGSSSENKFGATVGAGALLGQLDVKAQLEILDFGHTSDSLALMINVGYNFLKM